MQFIEANPLPKVCMECEERKELLARGEGEWCCDECDYLADRFIMVPDKEPKKNAKNLRVSKITRHQVSETDI